MILSIIRVILDKCISRFEIGTSWQSANHYSSMMQYFFHFLLSFVIFDCHFSISFFSFRNLSSEISFVLACPLLLA